MFVSLVYQIKEAIQNNEKKYIPLKRLFWITFPCHLFIEMENIAVLFLDTRYKYAKNFETQSMIHILDFK